jgi:hypothetical protein
LSAVFEDDDELQKMLALSDESIDAYKEFVYYIEGIPLDAWQGSADRIESFAIQQLEYRGHPNSLTKYVFQQKLNLLEQDINDGRRYIDVRFGEANGFVHFAKTRGVEPRADIPSRPVGGRTDVEELGAPYIFSKLDELFNEQRIDLSQQIYFYHEFYTFAVEWPTAPKGSRPYQSQELMNKRSSRENQWRSNDCSKTIRTRSSTSRSKY